MLLRRRKWLAAIVALSLVVAVLAWVPFPLIRLLAAVLPGFVWFVETNQPVVAITFDDGPDPVWTPQVLDLLAKHEVRATFFVVGENARRHPELVARIRAEGHEIGNHFDRVGTTLFLSEADFERDLLAAEQSIGLRAAAAQPDDGARRTMLFFRPPGGFIRPAHRAIALRHGYVSVLGSAYAFDPHGPPQAYIEWVIAKNLRPGAIAVLHDAGGDRSTNLAALAAILTAGKARGLRWVTLTELMQAGK